MKKLIPLAALLALALTGCLQPTIISGSVNGQSYSWSCAKDFTATNIVFEVTSNKTARLSFGYVTSKSSPAAITASGEALAQFTSAVAAGVGQAGAAAAKGAVAP